MLLPPPSAPSTPPTGQGQGELTPPVQETPEIVPSRTVAGRCVDPRRTARYADRQGTVAQEKRWVRSWIDETYLWYDEVPNLRAADYATPVAFFNVLKTPALTPAGLPKDRFHFSANTAELEQAATSGEVLGYGITFAYVQESVPRDVRVAYVEPGSPAAAAGIRRGDQLVAVDGIDAVSSPEIGRLEAGLAPRASGEQHTLRFKDRTGSERDQLLTAAAVTRHLVQNVKVLNSASGPLGYMQFNSHEVRAEAPLIDAMSEFKRQAVSELVIDMRYNGGGLLGIASELGYMVASDSATRGKVFEKLKFNRKNPFGLTEAQSSLSFNDTANYGERAGERLPQLGLKRVIVLTGPDTCSASEALVNALRGVDVQVDLVGGATCGKPYGFLPQDNCGTTYFAVQFQGVNAKGFGDYADGFAPTCAVPDDLGHDLGDENEGRLKAALHLVENKQCPPAYSASGNVLAKAIGTLSDPADAGPARPLLRQAPQQTSRVLDSRALNRGL